MSTLFQNATLINEQGRLSPHTDLLVEGGLIARIGPHLPAEGARVIDCTGQFLTPGLCNLHAHTPMNIFKGIAEDVNIDDWFNRELWPYESKITDEDIYWGSKLAIAEMAQNGVTAFADHYFGGAMIAQAARECGLRADIAYTAFGFGGDAAAEIQATEDLMDACAGDPLVQVRFGPHSPYMCTPEVLIALVERARARGVGIHLHVSETAAQVAESREKYGRTPFAVVADCGGFTLPCIVAHALYIEEGDLPLLGEDTFVAACPKTYLKLGMGEGGLWRHWKNLRLATGTDGAASSATVNPLEQARLFALLGKWRDQAEDFALEDIWRLLFAGHQALGFHSGRLEEGWAADLNVWSLDDPATAPLYDPLAAILYSADPARAIRHTLVGGHFVKEDGRLAFDVEEILRESARCAAAIGRRGKGESKLFF